MIVAHAFYTAGMHELAKVFVESFCLFHVNHEIPLVIDAMGIDRSQKRELKSRYPYMNIRDYAYPMEHWANQCGVSLKTLRDWRRQIEHGYVTEDSRTWKLLTAGDFRVHKVAEVLRGIGRAGYQDLLVHFDIDTLFRKSILGIEEFMRDYDVGLKLRPNVTPIKARITIDVMAIKTESVADMWLRDWCRIIDCTAPRSRPIGFGQSSCWEAYELSKGYMMRVGTLPLSYGLPGRNKSDDIVWCGNVHNLRKDDCVTYFREELERIKREGIE